MQTPEQMTKSMQNRLAKRKTILLWTVAIIWAILIIITLCKNLTTVKPVGQVIEHTVKYYENNLTQIANKYYPDEYLPDALTSIKKLNKMTESDIYVGQVLKVEVK